MIAIERVTKVLFAALFGWVIVMLALETAVRRRQAARRRARQADLEAAYRERPKTRPTTEFHVPWQKSDAPPSQRQARMTHLANSNESLSSRAGMGAAW